MSIVNNTNLNMPTLNGLLDINADSVNSTELYSDNINSNIVNTNSIIVDGIDIIEELHNVEDQVEENATKLTAISYIDTPTPTTIVSSNLTVEENTVLENEVSIGGNLKLGNESYLNPDGNLVYFGTVAHPGYLWIWGDCRIYGQLTLHAGFSVGTATINDSEIATLDGIDTTKTIQTQFNDLTTSVNDKLSKWGDTAHNQMQFDGGFTTKNLVHFLAGSGNFVLMGCPTFVNGTFTLQSTSGITLGAVSNILITQTELSFLSGLTGSIQSQLNAKANTSGASFSGLVLFNSGFICNAASTFNGSPSFYAKLECFANVKLNSSAGIELSSLATTITQTELSYLSAVSSNLQTQLNGKLGNTGSQTISNGQLFINSNGSSNLPSLQLSDLNSGLKGIKIICNTTILSPRPNPMIGDGESAITTNSNNNSSIVISPANTALQLGIRLLTSSSTTGAITIRANTNEIIVNQTEIGINGATTFSSAVLFLLASTFSNGFTSNGTITNNNPTNLLDNLNMNSSTTTKNRILQPIITSGDVSGSQNNLKYSLIRYNSGSATGTAHPCLTVQDANNNNTILFLPNSTAGAYNSSIVANSRAIIASGVQNSNTLSLSGWGSVRLGLKIQHFSSASASAVIESGLNSITIHNTAGIDIMGVNQIRFGSAGTTIKSDYGTTYTGTPITTILTSLTDTTVSSALTVPAGIYNISWVVGFEVITGSTTVSNYLACYSTSDTSYTDIVSRGSFRGEALSVGTLFTLQHSTTMTFTSTTNIYLRATCVFGTASRVQINADLSLLRAVKIA